MIWIYTVDMDNDCTYFDWSGTLDFNMIWVTSRKIILNPLEYTSDVSLAIL